MTFEKKFCPSPWFHMRIANSGTYEFCRWMDKADSKRIDVQHNLSQESPLHYFQNTMSPIRAKFLAGETLPECHECITMEQHGKVSGRQRQLLKVGIMEDHFEKTLASSPLRKDFDYSFANNGHTLRSVTDWQIDLGNYCNGACIMCTPVHSSRLATEFQKIGLIDSIPPPAWCDDEELLEQFIVDLKSCEKLQYIHFLGGETVITPGFKKILQALIEVDLAKNITIGFTTNLTVWSEEIIELLSNFQQVNLGMSIETLTKVNEYIRWPSNLPTTKELLDRWCALGKSKGWLMQLRITPTALSVGQLDSIYTYAWEKNLAVESCNFLNNPKSLRITVLPPEYRAKARTKLYNWLEQHPIDNAEKIINTRNPDMARVQIKQDIESYLNYLDTAEDESYRLPDLVAYLKKLEQSRGNSVLNYLPEYEELFRSAGY